MFSPSWGMLLVAGMVIAFIIFGLSKPNVSSVDYVFVWKQADKGNIEWVEYQGESLKGHWKKVPESPDAKIPKLTDDFELVLPVQMEMDHH